MMLGMHSIVLGISPAVLFKTTHFCGGGMSYRFPLLIVKVLSSRGKVIGKGSNYSGLTVCVDALDMRMFCQTTISYGTGIIR